MTKKDTAAKSERILELMTHFYPGAISYGGWPIHIKKEDQELVKVELKGALTLEKSKHGVLVASLPKPKWPTQYVIELLTYERDMYREEADKLYNGIKSLVG